MSDKDIKEYHNIGKKSGLKKTKLILEDYLANIQQLGAGEILLNCIDNDGMQKGYDIELIKKIFNPINQFH